MSAIQTLLGFTAWTVLLVVAIVLYRVARFLGGTPINHWPRGTKPADDAPVMQRLSDAHANCLENLPVFAAIVLSAAALGRLGTIDGLAPYVLFARVAQTATHLTGVGQAQVFVRATFWGIQLALFIWMMVKVIA